MCGRSLRGVDFVLVQFCYYLFFGMTKVSIFGHFLKFDSKHKERTFASLNINESNSFAIISLFFSASLLPFLAAISHQTYANIGCIGTPIVLPPYNSTVFDIIP